MESLNLPPFYEGQKVVYIADRQEYKDKVFTVRKLKQASCKCWAVDLGLSANEMVRKFCPNHPDSKLPTSLIQWFASWNLTPVEQTFRAIEFKEVIKIESPLIGIN